MANPVQDTLSAMSLEDVIKTVDSVFKSLDDEDVDSYAEMVNDIASKGRSGVRLTSRQRGVLESFLIRRKKEWW